MSHTVNCKKPQIGANAKWWGKRLLTFKYIFVEKCLKSFRPIFQAFSVPIRCKDAEIKQSCSLMKIQTNSSPWSFLMLPCLFLLTRPSFKRVSIFLRSHCAHLSHLQRSTHTRPERVERFHLKSQLCSLCSGGLWWAGFWGSFDSTGKDAVISHVSREHRSEKDGPNAAIHASEFRSQHTFLN